MKKQIIGTLGFLFACAFTCFFLVTAGYFYLNRSVDVTRTQEKVSDVPYEFSPPENKSILFEIGESKIALYLDFEEQKLYAADISSHEDLSLWPFGGKTDYTVLANREWVAELIDAVGGVVLTLSDEPLRYTGTQILEIWDEVTANHALLKAIIQRIGESGLDESEFKMTVTETETNLNLSDCYEWQDYIRLLFANPVFMAEDVSKSESRNTIAIISMASESAMPS